MKPACANTGNTCGGGAQWPASPRVATDFFVTQPNRSDFLTGSLLLLLRSAFPRGERESMLERSVSIVAQVSDGNFTIGSLYNYSKKNVLPILSFLTSIQFIRMIKGKDRTCQHPFPPPPPPPVSSFRLYHRSGWRVIKTINTWRTRVLPEGGGRGEGATRTTETQGEEWREAACMHIRGCIEYN